MNNILISVKRFLKNKNTVTVIGVMVIIGLLYFGYSKQVNNAVQGVSIPVAKVEIQPRTEITREMVEYISVPSIAVNSSVLRSSAAIVGKYSDVNAVIPKGSMFYQGVLVTKEQLPDSAFVEVKEGDIPYQFSVNLETTYGNSIFPGNKIDIYMKAIEDGTNKVMVGKLLENVEVLAVKDSQGRHVFENTTETRTPSNLIFGVPEDIHILLRKTEYMGNGVTLIPVPHGGTVTGEGEMQVSTQYLRDFIESHTVTIPENKPSVNPINPDDDNSDQNNEEE